MIWARLAIAIANAVSALARLFLAAKKPRPMTNQQVAESLEPGGSVVITRHQDNDEVTPLERPIPASPYGQEKDHD